MVSGRFFGVPDLFRIYGGGFLLGWSGLLEKIVFSNDELHIILKRGNLEICKHLSCCNNLLNKN